MLSMGADFITMTPASFAFFRFGLSDQDPFFTLGDGEVAQNEKLLDFGKPGSLGE